MVPGVREFFLQAYGGVEGLLEGADVVDRWGEPSALPGFTVGGLAGHLVRAGETPLSYLGAPAPVGPPIEPADYYIRALDTMDAAAHAGVVARGLESAAQGPGALLGTFRTTLARLRVALEREPSTRLVAVFAGLVMRLDDYLLTRLVETLVHSDDLAASVERRPPEPPEGAFDLALEHLLAVARRRHGDRAVLVALTRRERDTRDALRVFPPIQQRQGVGTVGSDSEGGHATR